MLALRSSESSEPAFYRQTRHARPCAEPPHLTTLRRNDVDGRDKPGHDTEADRLQLIYGLNAVSGHTPGPGILLYRRLILDSLIG